MKKALLIGINYKNDKTMALQGCVYDTIQMANALILYMGYHPADIYMLRDDIGQAPTRITILNYLNVLAIQSASLEEIWIYYAGHGISSKGLESAIAPIDYSSAGLITETDLFAIFQRIQCRTIAVFDCCHSGSICKLEWSLEYRNPSYCVRNQDAAKHLDNTDIIVYSGYRDHKSLFQDYLAIDSLMVDSLAVDSLTVVGEFTKTFLQCLQSKDFTYSPVYLYGDICTDLAKKGYSHRPAYSSSGIVTTFQFQKNMPTSMDAPYPLKECYIISSPIKPPVRMNLIQNEPVIEQNGTQGNRFHLFGKSSKKRMSKMFGV